MDVIAYNAVPGWYGSPGDRSKKTKSMAGGFTMKFKSIWPVKMVLFYLNSLVFYQQNLVFSQQKWRFFQPNKSRDLKHLDGNVNHRVKLNQTYHELQLHHSYFWKVGNQMRNPPYHGHSKYFWWPICCISRSHRRDIPRPSVPVRRASNGGRPCIYWASWSNEAGPNLVYGNIWCIKWTWYMDLLWIYSGCNMVYINDVLKDRGIPLFVCQ